MQLWSRLDKVLMSDLKDERCWVSNQYGHVFRGSTSTGGVYSMVDFYSVTHATINLDIKNSVNDGIYI